MEGYITVGLVTRSVNNCGLKICNEIHNQVLWIMGCHWIRYFKNIKESEVG